MKTTNYQGIVVEVTDRTIILLRDDGNFKNVPRSKSDVPQLGDTYTHVETQQLRGFRGGKYIALVSMFVLAIIGFYLSSFLQEDQSFLYAVDINPSIEIYTNNQLQVTSIKALNDDGKKVVDAIANKKKHVDLILDEVIDIAVKKKYLTNNEQGLVSLTVVPLNDAQDVDEQQAENALNESLHTHKVTADVSVTKGNKDLIEQSEQVDLSVNKYQVYDQLKKNGIDVDIEEIREKSIPLITEEANNNQKAGNKGHQKANPNAQKNKGSETNVDLGKPEKKQPRPNNPSNQSKDKVNRSNENDRQGNGERNNPQKSENTIKQEKQNNNGNRNQHNKDIGQEKQTKNDRLNENDSRNGNSNANPSANKTKVNKGSNSDAITNNNNKQQNTGSNNNNGKKQSNGNKGNN